MVAVSAPTAAKRTRPIERAQRHELVAQLLELVGLDVDPGDVLSVHVGTRTVGIRRRVRGRSGKIVHGHTLTTSHDVLPEALED